MSQPQDHSAIGRILCQWKIPMTPGIEPATFRFVPQHLNHCATASSLYIHISRRASPYLLPVCICVCVYIYIHTHTHIPEILFVYRQLSYQRLSCCVIPCGPKWEISFWNYACLDSVIKLSCVPHRMCECTATHIVCVSVFTPLFSYFEYGKTRNDCEVWGTAFLYKIYERRAS